MSEEVCTRNLEGIELDEIYDFEFCESGNSENGCSKGFPPECQLYTNCREEWIYYKMGLTPLGEMKRKGGGEKDESERGHVEQNEDI